MPENAVVLISAAVAATSLAVNWMVFIGTRRKDLLPVIVFTRKSRESPWRVKNVGRGPALELTVTEGGNDVALAVTGEDYAMVVGTSKGLSLSTSANILNAKYQDCFGNCYSTVCADNVNKWRRVRWWHRTT